jgi:HlyD family secretion protein
MTRALFRFAFLAAWLVLAPARADEPKPPRAVLEAKGYLVPARLAAVGPRSAGQVTQVLVEEGQKVKQGDVLAKLDDTLAKVDVQRAEAKLMVARARLALLKVGPPAEEVAAARAAVEQAEAETKLAQATLQRVEKLVADGSAPPTLLDKSRADVIAARGRLDKARSALDLLTKERRPEEVAVAEAECKVAEADRHRAAYLLDGMTVRAPFDGTVLSRKVDVGSFINPALPGAAATVCEIANLREMEVEVDIAEGDLAKVQRLQPCLVRVDALPNVTYKGAVVRVLPIVNRAKGTVAVRVRIDVPEKDEMLRAGMSALVVLLAQS